MTQGNYRYRRTNSYAPGNPPEPAGDAATDDSAEEAPRAEPCGETRPAGAGVEMGDMSIKPAGAGGWPGEWSGEAAPVGSFISLAICSICA